MTIEGSQKKGLFKAVREQDLAALTEMLADPEYRTSALERRSRGQSALHEAAQAAWVDGVELLIRAGFEVDGRDDEGRTPLHLAAEDGRNLKLMGLFRERSETRQQILRGRSVAFPGDQATAAAIARLLHEWGLVEGPGIPTEPWSKKAVALAVAFHEATWSDEARQHLLEALGERVDIEKRAPVLAAQLARRWPFEAVCRLLLEHGADIEARDGYGQTPLAAAVDSGAGDLVRWLINRGADVQTEDQWQRPLLEQAIERGHIEIANQLLVAGALPIQALAAAATGGHAELVARLVEYGADVDETSENEEAPIHAAARYGQADVIETLLELGAQGDLRNPFGETALHLAIAAHGRISLIDKLIDICGLETQDEDGHTPLHTAAMAVNLEAVERLLERGADARARSQAGDSPLHAFFADLDAFEIPVASRLLKRLIAAGADPAEKNLAGRSVLDIAALWKAGWLDDALTRRPTSRR